MHFNYSLTYNLPDLARTFTCRAEVSASIPQKVTEKREIILAESDNDLADRTIAIYTFSERDELQIIKRAVEKISTLTTTLNLYHS